MSCFVLDLDDTLVNTTRDLHGNYKRIPSLTLVDGAKEFLALHAAESVILSAGVHHIQQSKIDAVGIRHLVSHVVVVPTFEYKEKILFKFVRPELMPVSSVVVVGDRIDQEILLGNRLGCTTVRMRLPHGKYCGDMPLAADQRPHHTVENFFELLTLPL